MNTTTKLVFAENELVVPQLIDDETAEHHTSHIWPASITLSAYLQSVQQFYDQFNVKLGCGTGIPSLVLTKLHPNCHAVVTDRQSDVDVWRERMRSIFIDINKIQESSVTFLPLTWGSFDYELLKWSRENSDLQLDSIIAADIFYDSRDFDSILATVDFLFKRHKCSELLTAYHERDERHNLQQLMNKWSFKGELMDANPYITQQII
ncbi:hypothetical protein AKO1_013403 [Acrasis kona]|uniref:Uncharacterized protein n=1 Tax=Acrasis kona TaxID=1008807 RepID=A0AAW2YLL3_9EUKA